MRSRAGILIASAVLVASVVGATATLAGPGQTTWTTYLYQGPSTRYLVIDELQQLTPVDVRACDEAWCQVEVGGRLGYLQHEVVSLGDPAAVQPSLLPQPAASLMPNPPGPCFEAMQTGGNGGKMPTVFCGKAD